MLTPIFVMLAALTVSETPPSASPALVRPAHDRAAHGARPAPSGGANELYSLRARRRLTAYLRLRLLEMREAGLERAADVVERRLPVDALVPPLRRRHTGEAFPHS